MPAATASIADVSRGEDDRNKPGQPQAQCSPIPQPALGTQMIIQGNGTNVGTIISLQCPARHKLVGSQVECVMATNSTNWVGRTHCEPLSRLEDYGFRVAVLASIVSLGIIFFMSMAFITCCLLDCIKEDERKKQRDPELAPGEEQVQQRGDNRSHYSHKGRNNNNNTQETLLSPVDTHSPAVRDSLRVCRCHQVYDSGLDYSNIPTSSSAALPGRDYEQPLLPRDRECALSSGPPHYPGPPLLHCQAPRVQTSLMGTDLHRYGEQQRRLLGANPSSTDESNTGNINKEFSIRIISV